MSQNFLLNLPGETDRQLMNQASDGEALAQFSSNLAKMTLWGGNLIAHLGGANDKFAQMQIESKRQVDNMKLMHMELEKSYANLQEKYCNLQADHEKLDAQLLDVVARHSRELEKAKEEARRDFPNSEEGKQLLQVLLERKKEEFKEEFLCSDEFRKIVVDQTLVYYYFGYKYLKDQLKIKGIDSSVFKGIKRDDGLTTLPEDTSILQQADSDEESEEETEVPLS
ncbi:hypothetical protein CDL12_00647 [Handroanthus impetiginosus]|uniref:Uncharacterized protein n=1 Tax=Handroanthus impetiginosus TaxID=429701 RepID=A0A2G9IA95_9LAMI|nr:hypothetical protein CDL12_00647 [Handroanthus impetiginosus]